MLSPAPQPPYPEQIQDPGQPPIENPVLRCSVSSLPIDNVDMRHLKAFT
jgi:hypothetical protein